VISDEVAARPGVESGATVTLSDTGALPSLGQRDASQNSLKIRISDPDDSERRARALAPAVVPVVSGPAVSATDSPDEGSIVRVRDSAGDLQLASAEDEPLVEEKTTSIVSSRRSQVVVSDLFAPPAAVASQASARPIQRITAHEPTPAVVTSVQSARPRRSENKVQGHVSNIDSRSGTVRFRVNPGEAPAAGTLVKVYHRFLLGEECVGAIEVVDVQNGIATARPVGNVSLAKLSPGDHVAY
jgi:hypothetical protein